MQSKNCKEFGGVPHDIERGNPPYSYGWSPHPEGISQRFMLWSFMLQLFSWEQKKSAASFCSVGFLNEHLNIFLILYVAPTGNEVSSFFQAIDYPASFQQILFGPPYFGLSMGWLSPQHQLTQPSISIWLSFPPCFERYSQPGCVCFEMQVRNLPDCINILVTSLRIPTNILLEAAPQNWSLFLVLSYSLNAVCALRFEKAATPNQNDSSKYNALATRTR